MEGVPRGGQCGHYIHGAARRIAFEMRRHLKAPPQPLHREANAPPCACAPVARLEHISQSDPLPVPARHPAESHIFWPLLLYQVIQRILIPRDTIVRPGRAKGIVLV
jgi:hypothetical protein